MVKEGFKTSAREKPSVRAKSLDTGQEGKAEDEGKKGREESVSAEREALKSPHLPIISFLLPTLSCRKLIFKLETLEHM